MGSVIKKEYNQENTKNVQVAVKTLLGTPHLYFSYKARNDKSNTPKQAHQEKDSDLPESTLGVILDKLEMTYSLKTSFFTHNMEIKQYQHHRIFYTIKMFWIRKQ